MISELSVLRVLLLVSVAIAPLGSHRHFLPEPSRVRVAAYGAALACAAVSLFTPLSLASVGWLLFTAASFAVFLRSRLASLRAPETLAASVPFLFSNIAAVWLVAGTNELRLLGYEVHFSFYAALHGNVLGWMVVGAIAILAADHGPRRRVYVASIAVCLVSFLLVAFGIDRLRALKPVGVLGLSLAIPIAQLTFLREARSRSRASFALGALSLLGLGATMFLAWRSELARPVLVDLFGVRAMVAIHGALNALLVGPCLLFAVILDGRARRLDRSHLDPAPPSA